MKKMVSRRQFLQAAGLTAAAAALTACGSSSSSSAAGGSTAGGSDTSSVITIGVMGPLTGGVSVYGNAVVNGAMLYLNQVNENGGINGKQLNIIKEDEKGDATEAVTVFNKMLDSGIVGLIGDVTTTPTLAVVAESQEYNMPMVTASATAAAVTYDADTDTVYENVYRATFIDPFQGIKMADYAVEKLGLTKVAVLYKTGDDYSEGLAQSFQDELVAKGGVVTDVQAFSEGDVDFNAQLTSIAASSPDAVYLPYYYEDIGQTITQARAQGITVPFLGGDGWDGLRGGAEEYASAEDVQGCYFLANYAPGISPEFESAYQAAYGEAYPNGFAPLGYDAAMTLCAGLQAAEDAGLDPVADYEDYKQAVIDGIDKATVEGVTGTFTFDEYNNPVKATAFIGFNEAGAPTFVEHF